jgi:HPt (histidine-containing phosphotransfer) domain-containing protein
MHAPSLRVRHLTELAEQLEDLLRVTLADGNGGERHASPIIDLGGPDLPAWAAWPPELAFVR